MVLAGDSFAFGRGRRDLFLHDGENNVSEILGMEKRPNRSNVEKMVDTWRYGGVLDISTWTFIFRIGELCVILDV